VVSDGIDDRIPRRVRHLSNSAIFTGHVAARTEPSHSWTVESATVVAVPTVVCIRGSSVVDWIARGVICFTARGLRVGIGGSIDVRSGGVTFRGIFCAVPVFFMITMEAF
jgi:hypothetical protein